MQPAKVTIPYGCLQGAGVKDRNEAELLYSNGIFWIGFPFFLPVNKEDCSLHEAASIIKKLPSTVIPVLITYLTDPDKIKEILIRIPFKALQLHEYVPPNILKKLRSQLPHICIIKSMVVGTAKPNDQMFYMKQIEQDVDGFLTDSYDPTTKAKGATGKTHNWEVSKQFIKHTSKPVILAGGLSGENVESAILKVKPWGVDAHTGLEDELGRKDQEKIQRFVKKANKAFSLK